MRTLLFAALLLAAAPAAAQEEGETEAEEETEAPPENGVIADLSLGVISLAYERIVTPALSVQLAVGLYGPWYQSEGVLGAGAELRAFVFPAGGAPFGVYLSPGVRGAWVRAEDDDGARDGGAWSVRFSWGYSFDVRPLIIRLGAGAQYHVVEIEEPREGPRQSFATVFPVVDAYVGFVF